MHQRSWRIVVCVVLVARASNPLLAQTIRDSAGIHVVENAKPIWTAAQTQHLAATPSLVIGTQPGPNYELSKVAGAARLSDGRIVVADGASLQLRFFDAAGTFIKSSGRKGEGPGEFMQLDRFSMLAGDTIVAGAFGGALSQFTGAGAFVRAQNPNAPPVTLPPGFRVNIAVLTGNTRVIAMGGRFPFKAVGTRWVDSFPVGLFDGKNTLIRSLGRLPQLTAQMDDQGPMMVWLAPIAAFAANASSFFAGFGSEYSISVFNPKGVLERMIRRRWAPAKVSSGDWDTFVTEWSKRWIKTTGAEADKEKQELQGASHASTVPAFSQFLADRTGRLWVREAHLADAPGAGALSTMPLVPSVWSVFDAQGRWLEDVTMPARFNPTDIGANYVLGVAKDGDGVETVVMYRLTL